MRPDPGGWVLPGVAGGLLALSFPPLGPPFLVFLALVPLLAHIEDCPHGPAGRWRATRAGLITGGVYFGLQLYWFLLALLPRSALAVPAYLGAVLGLAGLVGAFGWATHAGRDGLRLPLAVRALILWTAIEWVQGHLGDLAFPWLGLGAALTPWPTLAGAADLVGGRGLTAWVAAVNGVLATVVLRLRQRRPVAGLATAALLLVAGPVAYGVWRTATLELRPAARIAVVQPDIPQEVKLDPEIALDSSLAALTALTRPLAGRAVDLIVWPEVALPADLAASEPLRARVAGLSAAAGAPILVGAYRGQGAGAGRQLYNSAFLVGSSPHPGGGASRYDKRRLVPFVERIPFAGGRLIPGGGRRFGGLARGREAPLFPVVEDARVTARFGALICFEAIFPDLSRDYRRDGADFLVNLTNDAWFGAGPAGHRTAALWQHPAHAVLRAIETRIGIARAANTGISMFVDPLGRVRDPTPLFAPATRIDTVYTTIGATAYVRWGDWLGSLCALAGALLALAAWRSSPGRRHRVVQPRLRS